MRVFGVDIGGTGIKGAPVEVDDGTLVAPRVRVPTPSPAEPVAVAAAVAEVVGQFGWEGPVGAAFPAVVRGGVALTAANVAPSWIGTDVAATLAGPLGGREIVVVNDADAAGMAEMAFGAGRDVPGVVVVVTLGTGIGTALFVHGQLVPNTELGHIEIDGHDAETRASDAARERDDLSWEHWAKRVSRYLDRLDKLLWPDMIILGGGVSKRADKFLHLLEVDTRVVPAQLLNDAGIVGAALAAANDPGRGRTAARAVVRRRPPVTRPPGGRRP
jgi:polyphosphate glucokinase